MAHKQALVVLGLGDGGTNGLISFCEINTDGNFAAVSLNTNGRSNIAAQRTINRIIPVRLGIKYIPQYNGSGQDPNNGLQAMLESLKDGSIDCVIDKFDPLVAIVLVAFGEGGTGLGGAWPLIQHLREIRRLVTLPVIVSADVNTGIVNYQRSQFIKQELGRLDTVGIAFLHAPVSNMNERYRGLDPQQAFGETFRQIAQTPGALIRFFKDPTLYDLGNFVDWIYQSKNPQGRRLMMNSCTIPADPKIRGDAWASQAANQLLHPGPYQFDFGDPGGAVLVIEGHMTVQERTLLLQEIRRALADLCPGERRANFHLSPIFFPRDGHGDEIRVSLLFAELGGGKLERPDSRLNLYQWPEDVWETGEQGGEEQPENGDVPDNPKAAKTTSTQRSGSPFDATAQERPSGKVLPNKERDEPQQQQQQPQSEAAAATQSEVVYSSLSEIMMAWRKNKPPKIEELLVQGRATGYRLEQTGTWQERYQEFMKNLEALYGVRWQTKLAFHRVWRESWQEAVRNYYREKDLLLPGWYNIGIWTNRYQPIPYRDISWVKQLGQTGWYHKLNSEQQKLAEETVRLSAVLGEDLAADNGKLFIEGLVEPAPNKQGLREKMEKILQLTFSPTGRS